MQSQIGQQVVLALKLILGEGEAGGRRELGRTDAGSRRGDGGDPDILAGDEGAHQRELDYILGRSAERLDLPRGSPANWRKVANPFWKLRGSAVASTSMCLMIDA